MHLCIFNHRLTRRSDSLHNLFLRLTAQPYSGLVDEEASPPIVFTPARWSGWHLPIGFVLFYNLYLKHLELLAKTWGLCSVLEVSPFDFWCLTFSGGISGVVGKCSFTGNFLASCSCFTSDRSSWQSLLLYPGCWYPLAHMLAVS